MARHDHHHPYSRPPAEPEGIRDRFKLERYLRGAFPSSRPFTSVDALTGNP